ncbi:hypothetical protein ROZALSC1DRAFT_29692, partial [Rozella allomycis CSF55]
MFTQVGFRCKTCGTTKHTQTQEGLYICQYGHQTLDYLNEEIDPDAFASQSRMVKTKKLTVSQKTEEKKTVTKILLYQVDWMIKNWECDAVVKDVMKKQWLCYASEAASIYCVDKKVNDDEISEISTSSESEENYVNLSHLPELKLHLSLSFCYLSLIYSNNAVCLADIHRLALQSKFPCLNILQTLKTKPFKELNDKQLTQNTAKVYKETEKLLYYLIERHNFPHPTFNTTSFFFKAIRSLLIPYSLYPFAIELLKLGDENGQAAYDKFVQGLPQLSQLLDMWKHKLSNKFIESVRDMSISDCKEYLSEVSTTLQQQLPNYNKNTIMSQFLKESFMVDQPEVENILSKPQDLSTQLDESTERRIYNFDPFDQAEHSKEHSQLVKFFSRMLNLPEFWIDKTTCELEKSINRQMRSAKKKTE